MRPEVGFFQSMRRGWSSSAIVMLLTAAALAGDPAIIGVLRGEDGRQEAAPLGYYEGLLQTEGGDGARAVGPPPGWVAFGDPEAGIVEEVRSYLRWKMRPDLDITWNGAVFRTNSLGFRSPEVTLEKPRGTYRILVFGSSNTMGYGIGNEEMFTYHLEQWLGRNEGRRRAVEVVNLALSGDSPSRRLYRIQQEAERLSPDWILCDVSFFDPWLEDRHVQAVIEKQLPIPFPFVEESIRRSGVRGWVNFETFSETFRGESERLLEDVYAALAAESRRLKIPLTLIVLPRSDGHDKSPRLRGVIHVLAERNGLDCLDLSDAFDGLRVEEFRISEWDKHTSAGGHRVIFEAIRDALIDRGGLPGGGHQR
jgi:hypothetical protein